MRHHTMHKAWNIIMKYIYQKLRTSLRIQTFNWIDTHLSKEEKKIEKMLTIGIYIWNGNWHGVSLVYDIWICVCWILIPCTMFHVPYLTFIMFDVMVAVISALSFRYHGYTIAQAQNQWQTNEHIISVKQNIEYSSFSLRLRFRHHKFHISMLGIIYLYKW